MKKYVLATLLAAILISCTQDSGKSRVLKISDANTKLKLNETSVTPEPKVDLSEMPIKEVFDGVQLKPVIIAINALNQDEMVSDINKRIENYQIELFENDKKYFVFFNPDKMVKENSEPTKIQTRVGKSMYYVIEKSSLEVKARYFLKN